MHKQKETFSYYKMSCQEMFGKYCYWGAYKRKQILSVTSVTEKREEKGMNEVLQWNNLAKMAASLG